MRKMNIDYHFYADDTQIYLSFDVEKARYWSGVERIEEVVTVIKKWMLENFLCLNDDKTEVLLIGSTFNHKQLSIPTVSIGDVKISPAESAKNIGFVFDKFMDGKLQISSTCKAAWFHLRNIGKIRQYLDRKSTEQLVHSFVSSKLDFNNALLYGLPDNLIRKLQTVQNAAARLVMKVPKRCHITPILAQLHWLPVQKRINYKIILLVFKALNSLAPQYVSEMLQYKKPTTQSLRSDSRNLLVVPFSRTVTYGDRNFRNVGPILWNDLPQDMRDCSDLKLFKKMLKTLLFRQAYELDV